MGNTPVDIAGFMGHLDLVKTFCKDLEKKILVENRVRMQAREDAQVPPSDNEASAAPSSKLSQVSPASLTTSGLVRDGREVQREMGNAFATTPEGDKLIIECVKVKRQQLDHEEAVDMHCFYWAAFYGLNKYLRYMVLSRRWSPFIKSFQNRSAISGAVWGEQTETIRMLLGDYKYANVSSLNLMDFANNIYNKDHADNNCLHYCYMIDLPEVRQILRENGLFNERAQKLNRRGQLPTQLRHYSKAEDSNEESEENEQADADLSR